MFAEHAQWYNVLSGEPSPLNAADYGWEADDTNICLTPCNVENGVPYPPVCVFKLVGCSCGPERPCRYWNCGCTGRQLVCIVFCACGCGLPRSIQQKTLVMLTITIWISMMKKRIASSGKAVVCSCDRFQNCLLALIITVECIYSHVTCLMCKCKF